MDELRMLLGAYIQNNEIILSATASNPRNREKLAKIRLRPIHMKNTLYYQAERFVGTKVFHQNIEPLQIPDFFAEAMEVDFRQLELETAQHKVIVLVSKKGNISIKEKTKYVCADTAVQFTENGTNQTALDSAALQTNFAHNREKNYILPQEEPVPFLVALGVQTAQGKVVHAKYDKFRQINRYLEFVRDILPYLPNNGKTLRIVDFGCGKSYLTFALYYYLKVMQNYNISVTGLDLKQDVIEKCQALADKLEYNGLKFLQCACHFTDACANGSGEMRSRRQEVKELIQNLKQTNPYVEGNIFKSVENVNLSTLIAYKQYGKKHHFLERYNEECNRKITQTDKC